MIEPGKKETIGKEKEILRTLLNMNSDTVQDYSFCWLLVRNNFVINTTADYTVKGIEIVGYAGYTYYSAHVKPKMVHFRSTKYIYLLNILLHYRLPFIPGVSFKTAFRDLYVDLKLSLNNIIRINVVTYNLL